jgi:hypothetical protein
VVCLQTTKPKRTAPSLQVLIDTHDQCFPDQEFNMVRLVVRVARGMEWLIGVNMQAGFQHQLNSIILISTLILE